MFSQTLIAVTVYVGDPNPLAHSAVHGVRSTRVGQRQWTRERQSSSRYGVHINIRFKSSCTTAVCQGLNLQTDRVHINCPYTDGYAEWIFTGFSEKCPGMNQTKRSSRFIYFTRLQRFILTPPNVRAITAKFKPTSEKESFTIHSFEYTLRS